MLPQPLDGFLFREYKPFVSPENPGDSRFVVGSWLHAQRFVPPFDGLSRAAFDYFQVMPAKIEAAIKRGRVVVACVPEDEDVLCGFVAVEDPDILQYVYVRHPYRHLGVARALVVASGLNLENGLKVTMQWHGPRAKGTTGSWRNERIWPTAQQRYRLAYDPSLL